MTVNPKSISRMAEGDIALVLSDTTTGEERSVTVFVDRRDGISVVNATPGSEFPDPFSGLDATAAEIQRIVRLVVEFWELGYPAEVE